MEIRSKSSTALETILRNEISVLNELYACQKRMYECVLVRDWVLLQKETAGADALTDRFVELENTRIWCARSVCPDSDGSKDFYRVTEQFAEDERKTLNQLFREVKSLLVLSKSENDVFNTYIANARSIVSGLLETVMPARRNKIYTRQGALASAPVESLVVNRSF